jgi:hypothetical protein
MSVSFAAQEVALRLHDQAAPLPELERTITALEYQFARLCEGDDEDKVPDL